ELRVPKRALRATPVHVLWPLVTFSGSAPACWLAERRPVWSATKRGLHSALIASGVRPTLHRRPACLRPGPPYSHRTSCVITYCEPGVALVHPSVLDRRL